VALGSAGTLTVVETCKRNSTSCTSMGMRRKRKRERKKKKNGIRNCGNTVGMIKIQRKTYKSVA
jgi:hypothetical protein